MRDFGYAEMGYPSRLKRRQLIAGVRTGDKFRVRRDGVSDEAEMRSY